MTACPASRWGRAGRIIRFGARAAVELRRHRRFFHATTCPRPCVRRSLHRRGRGGDRRSFPRAPRRRPTLRSRRGCGEARRAPDALGNLAEGELLIALAPHLEDFLASLFGIEDEVRALEAAHHALAPLYAVKRQFVQRKAMNAHKADAAAAFDGPALRAALEARIGAPIVGRRHEIAFANAVTAWQKDEAAHAESLELALRYAAWAAHTPAGRAAHRDGVLFRAPRKLDPMKLVPIVPVKHAGVTAFDARRPPPPRARRLRADRPRDRPRRRARPGALLHLVPRAGQGLLLARAAREEAGRRHAARGPVQEEPVRRDARRLPARGAHLRVPQAASRRLGARARSR